MATVIRPELSTKNKYYIDKHRHYELKYFCLQYPMWKRTYSAMTELSSSALSPDRVSSTNSPTDLTAKCAMRRAYYGDKIRLIEKVAMETDEYLYKYLIKSVTEGVTYTYLSTKLRIPCSRSTFYDRYRKFFWLLSQIKD